jgi:hypothetical protein
MFCTACDHTLGECTCPDADARILAARQHTPMKWCKTCDKHYARCKCSVPNFTLMDGDIDRGCGPFRTMAGLRMIDPHVR